VRTRKRSTVGASLGWQSKSNSFNESEMALFYECMLMCARKLLDTADIVKEAMFHQLSFARAGEGGCLLTSN
jgi:hypothetical protein